MVQKITVWIGDRIIEIVDKVSYIVIVDNILKPRKQIIIQCRENKNGLKDDYVYFIEQLRKLTFVKTDSF